MKTCRTCLKTFPNTNEYFYRNTNYRDGLLTQCKECYKAYCKRYESRSEVRARRKAYWQRPDRYAHWLEYQREYQMKWRRKHGVKAKKSVLNRLNYLKRKRRVFEKVMQ